MRNYNSHGRGRGFNNNRRRNYSRGRSNFGGRRKSQSMNPLMFVRKAEQVVEEKYEPKNKFADFLLSDQVKRNVEEKGFTDPTAIQDEAIEPILQGRDLVGIANTGTGKTAAFLLPLISKVARNKEEKVLIVAPTRELAVQIREELMSFNKGMSIYSALCIGGASMGRQASELSRNPGFVIGTPGRIKDLNGRRMLDLGKFNNVVLDEVDRMLDMGFVRDIREIISMLPEKRQSLFFSATLPEDIKVVMAEFLKNPVTVSVKTGTTANNIDQDIVKINGGNKVEILHELLITKGFEKVLVFGRTKWEVSKLELKLADRGFKVASIHGQKSQSQRLRALRQLKSGEVQVLVATDVASRGIDIDDITHVINYDVPESYEDYVHRIGRTGRAGKKGVSLTFVD